ncbi:MAG: hypothetical protein EZS28_044222, partial [Streblomastix strix]
QKQRDKNLQVDSEDIEIGPYHPTTRDQDITILIEEVNQENDQDQGVIEDRETIKAQEKPEWMSIRIIMDLKLEVNQEAEAEEHIEEVNIVINEGDITFNTEINQIRRHIEKHRSITHTQNGSLARLRIQQTGMERTNMRIRIEKKAWMITQIIIGQNAHRCRKTQQRIIMIEIQPGQKTRSGNTMQQRHNPNDLPNKHKEYKRYRCNQSNKLKPGYRKRKGKLINHRIKTTLMNRKYCRKDQLHNRKRMNNIIYPTQRMSVNNETAKQQQQTTSLKTQQRIVSPLSRMINTGMNKDKPSSQTQLLANPTQKPVYRSGVKQRQKKQERELEQLKAIQQLQQQEIIDLNNTNIEIPDIQGTVGQLTGLQPSSGAQNPGLNAGPKLKEAGSISAIYSERIEPQINEGQQDNAEEGEDEQTDEAAINLNKYYRVYIISQSLVQENQVTQS